MNNTQGVDKNQPGGSRSTLFPHAQAYAARGWSVFPVLGKRPTTAWREQATTDSAALRRLWSRWNAAAFGVAMATGEPSGLWVLDVDVKADRDGTQELRRLESIYGELPPTVTARTGGGGVHLFFRMPPDREITNSRGRLPPGIDVRGTGGYVVLPPSPHPEGIPYRWMAGRGPAHLPPAYAPTWLLELLERSRSKPSAPPTFTPPTSHGLHGSARRAYVMAAIERECLQVESAPEGTRNDQLNKSAHALARFVAAGSADGSAVASALAYAAATAGLSEREIAKTLESAFRARGVR